MRILISPTRKGQAYFLFSFREYGFAYSVRLASGKFPCDFKGLQATIGTLAVQALARSLVVQ